MIKMSKQMFYFTMINLFAYGLIAYTIVSGFALKFLEQDSSYISYGIIFLFIIGNILSYYKMHKATRYPNPSFNKIVLPGTLRFISYLLLGLGIFGTYVGVKMSFDVLSADLLDKNAFATAMSVAINTTILGAVFSAWTDVNAHLINYFKRVN